MKMNRKELSNRCLYSILNSPLLCFPWGVLEWSYGVNLSSCSHAFLPLLYTLFHIDAGWVIVTFGSVVNRKPPGIILILIFCWSHLCYCALTILLKLLSASSVGRFVPKQDAQILAMSSEKEIHFPQKSLTGFSTKKIGWLILQKLLKKKRKVIEITLQAEKKMDVPFFFFFANGYLYQKISADHRFFGKKLIPMKTISPTFLID